MSCSSYKSEVSEGGCTLEINLCAKVLGRAGYSYNEFVYGSTAEVLLRSNWTPGGIREMGGIRDLIRRKSGAPHVESEISLADFYLGF